MTANQTVIVKSEKSVGIALLLTFLFGPLGMLYSTVKGGLVMFFVTLVVFLVTAGLGILLTHPICLIWAAVAANNYNKALHATPA